MRGNTRIRSLAMKDIETALSKLPSFAAEQRSQQGTGPHEPADAVERLRHRGGTTK